MSRAYLVSPNNKDDPTGNGRHLYKSGSTTTRDVPNNIYAHQYYRVCLCSPTLLESSQVPHVMLVLHIKHGKSTWPSPGSFGNSKVNSSKVGMVLG